MFLMYMIWRTEKCLHYETYKPLMEQFELDYVPCYWTMKMPTIDKLLHILPLNTYLMKDGAGAGEGVVVKNYDFVNRFGRTTWAKLVSNEFKEKNAKEFGHQNTEVKVSIEEQIVEKFCTEAFIEKEYAKLVLNQEWF